MNGMNAHYAAVLASIRAGRLVPLLGAGASLAGRPAGTPWTPKAGFPPSAYELASYLADRYGYPEPEPNLLRLSQYIAAVAGRGALYGDLREIFSADYVPTAVHRLIASLPALKRARAASSAVGQIVLTTNYDDLMERAFRDAGEAVDTVWYVADGQNRGKFIHRLDHGEVSVIGDTNYRGLDLRSRSLVLKLHGSFDPFDATRDSYVITEDDYIEYLIRADVKQLLPTELAETLFRADFLFLGSGLRDWNLQVILHRIWGEQELPGRSWAVQLDPGEVDRILWNRRSVDIIPANLGDYASELFESARQAQEQS